MINVWWRHRQQTAGPRPSSLVVLCFFYMCACVLLALADRFLQSKAICHFILGFCALSIRFDGRLKTVAILFARSDVFLNFIKAERVLCGIFLHSWKVPWCHCLRSRSCIFRLKCLRLVWVFEMREQHFTHNPINAWRHDVARCHGNTRSLGDWWHCCLLPSPTIY